jgi:enoyl-CoA hydratase/carnithine racemase
MPRVNLEAHDAIAVLRLNNGVTNAISPELVDDLSETIKQIKNEFKGMVLAGGDKFFCIGLDLPNLLQLDRPDMTEFYGRFIQAVFDLYTLPMPTACAIDGHATAGSAIFSISLDFRFVSSGRRFIGFNEVKIGLPIPYLVDLMLRQIVGDRSATELMFSGEFVEPEEALRIGLVDEVVAPEDLEEKAVAKISEMAALPACGLTIIKNNRIEAVTARYQDKRGADPDWFLDCWFNPAVQELLSEAAKKF